MLGEQEKKDGIELLRSSIKELEVLIAEREKYKAHVLASTSDPIEQSLKLLEIGEPHLWVDDLKRYHYAPDTEDLRKELKSKKRALDLLVGVSTGFDSWPAAIAKAKEYPILSLIEVSPHGMARCPWHNEKTASLKVYPDNHAHCFGCGKSGDSIDIVRALSKLSFLEAVRHLNSL